MDIDTRDVGKMIGKMDLESRLGLPIIQGSLEIFEKARRVDTGTIIGKMVVTT